MKISIKTDLEFEMDSINKKERLLIPFFFIANEFNKTALMLSHQGCFEGEG